MLHRITEDLTKGMNEVHSRYAALLKKWHGIINAELFAGRLAGIEIRVFEHLCRADYHAVNARYCFPNGGAPYMEFSYDALLTAIFSFATDENWSVTEEEIREETREIIAGTLLHEMIHQYAHENRIPDVEYINGLDYHTEAFRDSALGKGLCVLETEDPRYKNGYSKTHIAPDNPIMGLLPSDPFIDSLPTFCNPAKDGGLKG